MYYYPYLQLMVQWKGDLFFMIKQLSDRILIRNLNLLFYPSANKHYGTGSKSSR